VFVALLAPAVILADVQRHVVVQADNLVQLVLLEVLELLVVDDAAALQSAALVRRLVARVPQQQRDQREAGLLRQIQNRPDALDVAAMNPLVSSESMPSDLAAINAVWAARIVFVLLVMKPSMLSA